MDIYHVNHAVERWKQSLVSHSCASLEGINAETNEDNGGPVHKGSEGNKDSLRNWDVGHWCDIVGKDLIFFPASFLSTQ